MIIIIVVVRIRKKIKVGLKSIVVYLNFLVYDKLFQNLF